MRPVFFQRLTLLRMPVCYCDEAYGNGPWAYYRQTCSCFTLKSTPRTLIPSSTGILGTATRPQTTGRYCVYGKEVCHGRQRLQIQTGLRPAGRDPEGVEPGCVRIRKDTGRSGCVRLAHLPHGTAQHRPRRETRGGGRENGTLVRHTGHHHPPGHTRRRESGRGIPVLRRIFRVE